MDLLASQRLDSAREGAGAEAALTARVGRALGPRTRRLILALSGNPLFDADWYSAQNQGLAPGDARRHWKTIGVKELRDPSPHFSTRAYLERYPDVRSSGMNPLDHYFVFGMLEGRTPGP